MFNKQAIIEGPHAINKRIRQIEQEADAKIQQDFEEVFSLHLPADISLEFKGSSLYFQSNGKDIFSLYFPQKFWRPEEDEDLYTSVNLSYYTTSTNSTFELNRLKALGIVADLLLKNSEGFISTVNTRKAIAKQTIATETLYIRLCKLEAQLRDLKKAEKLDQRKKLEEKLCSSGLDFGEKVQYVTLKCNFTAPALTIKVTSISASGKTCTVQYTTSQTIGTYTPYYERPLVEERVDYHRLVQELLCMKDKIIN